MEVHPYFWRSRGKHNLVTYAVAVEVAKNKRSWLYLDPETGRTKIYGYSPKIKLWVRVIVLPDGRLFNGFWEHSEDAREAVRDIAAGRR